MAIISDGFFREGMGGAPVSASYLTTAADPTLTAEVVLTATQTELNYVGGVTSALQTQLNNKSASGHTHTLANVTDITASAAEVNFTDGVTSAIQTQLDGKQPLDADLTALAAMGDPGEDRIVFWDESSNTFTYLTAGTNLTITDTTIAAAGSTDGWYIPIDVFTTWKATVGTWAVQTGVVSAVELIGNSWIYNSTNAQNDEFTLDLYIPAGTWVVGGVVSKTTNRAIFSFQLDGTERWTYDSYAASDTFNTLFETGTYAVPATAKYTFKVKAANRNASNTTGWYLSPQRLYLRRTA